MTALIKNGGYAFLIRLNLMFPMSLWKEFELLQILNGLSIRHLIKRLGLFFGCACATSIQFQVIKKETIRNVIVFFVFQKHILITLCKKRLVLSHKITVDLILNFENHWPFCWSPYLLHLWTWLRKDNHYYRKTILF